VGRGDSVERNDGGFTENPAFRPEAKYEASRHTHGGRLLFDIIALAVVLFKV